MEANRFLVSCSNFSNVMTSRYDMKTSWQYIHDNCMVSNNRNTYRNTCVSSLWNIDKLTWEEWRIISLALLQAEIEYILFLSSWHDVMTWRHHANTKLTTFLNSATQCFIETNKNHLSSTSTSWVWLRHTVTSWHHSVKRLNEITISQLYLVNGTWGYGKMTLLVEANIFSYKMNVILCHNVDFDVTIMTSWRL